MKTTSTIKKILFTAVFIALIGLVGQLDYAEEIQQENHYCEMIKAGFWPEFKKSVKCN